MAWSSCQVWISTAEVKVPLKWCVRWPHILCLIRAYCFSTASDKVCKGSIPPRFLMLVLFYGSLATEIHNDRQMVSSKISLTVRFDSSVKDGWTRKTFGSLDHTLRGCLKSPLCRWECRLCRRWPAPPTVGYGGHSAYACQIKGIGMLWKSLSLSWFSPVANKDTIFRCKFTIDDSVHSHHHALAAVGACLVAFSSSSFIKIWTLYLCRLIRSLIRSYLRQNVWIYSLWRTLFSIIASSQSIFWAHMSWNVLWYHIAFSHSIDQFVRNRVNQFDWAKNALEYPAVKGALWAPIGLGLKLVYLISLAKEHILDWYVNCTSS